jgi:hypothetical protein
MGVSKNMGSRSIASMTVQETEMKRKTQGKK